MATVVIDTDPGTDDAIALIMALNSPELEIKGLTTVGGNARLTHTTANALRLLDRLGHPEIPVAAGASRPLRGAYEYGYGFHGSGGLTIALRPVDSGPHPLRAAEFIIDAGSTYGPDLTLIALGPLTNVAHALQRQPVLASQLHEIIVMGGALEGGNVTPYAEFNIYNDPTAANVVFSSGVPTTMIGLDVCRQVAFDRNKTDWSDGETVGEELAAEIVSAWFEFQPDQPIYDLCDPLAMAAVVEPGILTYTQAEVVVATSGPRSGETRATTGARSVKVATGVDVNRAHAMVLARLKTPEASFTI